jgi:hypothetical protein
LIKDRADHIYYIRKVSPRSLDNARMAGCRTASEAVAFYGRHVH